MLQGIYASTMWYFRSMDAMGIYVIATGIIILLCFTATKNHVLLISGHPWILKVGLEIFTANSWSRKCYFLLIQLCKNFHAFCPHLPTSTTTCRDQYFCAKYLGNIPIWNNIIFRYPLIKLVRNIQLIFKDYFRKLTFWNLGLILLPYSGSR